MCQLGWLVTEPLAALSCLPSQSYFTSECDRAQGRRKTFTPDQNARMRCAYQCYRLGQCQDGTFMY